MTYDGTHHYYYDAENRLKSIDTTTQVYFYDASGRRVKRPVGSETTFSFYGLTGLMSEFSTVSGATEAASTDRLEYRVGEQTGTAVMLVAASGDARENNRVFPFGEPWLSFAGSNNDEKFTTYQRDDANGEAGLDYAMARYYASRSGRFMTPDPGHVGADPKNPQSWNGYVYSANDPINHVDPAGTEFYVICKENESGGFLRNSAFFDRTCITGGDTQASFEELAFELRREGVLFPLLGRGGFGIIKCASGGETWECGTIQHVPDLQAPIIDDIANGALAGVGQAAAGAIVSAGKVGLTELAAYLWQLRTTRFGEKILLDADRIIAKALKTQVFLDGTKAPSRQAAYTAMIKWVGANATPIFERGSTRAVGWISEDGLRVARYTSMNSRVDPYINLELRNTAGNDLFDFHVRW